MSLNVGGLVPSAGVLKFGSKEGGEIEREGAAKGGSNRCNDISRQGRCNVVKDI